MTMIKNDNTEKFSIKNKNNYNKIRKTWNDMMRRCYDNELHVIQPTYKNCCVCDEWHDFNNFLEWYNNNFPYHIENMGIKLELDKDLLSEGECKIYSPDTCIFIPKKANGFTTNIQRNNTSGFTGVSWRKDICKWHAQTRDFNTGKKKHIGFFEDLKLASIAYDNQRKIESNKCKKWLIELGYNENIVNKIK